MSYDPSHRKGPPRQARWPQATPPEAWQAYREDDAYPGDRQPGVDDQGSYWAAAAAGSVPKEFDRQQRTAQSAAFSLAIAVTLVGKFHAYPLRIAFKTAALAPGAIRSAFAPTSAGRPHRLRAFAARKRQFPALRGMAPTMVVVGGRGRAYGFAEDDDLRALPTGGAAQNPVMQGQILSPPVVIVTMRGNKSGKIRKLALMRVEHDGEYALVASLGGAPKHPVWYYNLKANPRITVEVGTQTFTVLAEELDGTVRAELWPKLVAEYPSIGEYQARTARQIPVFMLTRQD